MNKFQGETSHLGAKGTLQKSKRCHEDVSSQGQDSSISKRSKLKREEGAGSSAVSPWHIERLLAPWHLSKPDSVTNSVNIGSGTRQQGAKLDQLVVLNTRI